MPTSPLLRRNQPATLTLPASSDPAIIRAARAVAADLTAAVGSPLVIDLFPDAREPKITAGIAVGQIDSPHVQQAAARGELNLSALTDPQTGQPRWEGFMLQRQAAVLWVVGTDRRGTIYGLYELAALAGISPWTWWADVPLPRLESLNLPADFYRADWPAVQYRGAFLNDEEELENWARTHTGADTIGPQTYERIFELLLRLRGNYIWPAMHVNAFNADPRNGELAHEMGIVVGTSHCDMLLRSNENEWPVWAAQRGEQVAYDYSIPGANRTALQDYWRGSVQQNAAYEVSWTVGMRGVHDYGFSTSAIDADPTLTPQQRTAAQVGLLEQVIADQRALLDEELGTNPGERLELFIPYKEVLPLYDAGLQVPPEVTIVWSNDNFGYMRRYPDTAERTRPGGHGLYYHNSYWSPPGRSYLFTSSTRLTQMHYELGKAWDAGIQRLWVTNIGGLKPLETELEFFLALAWGAGRDVSVRAHLAGCIARDFPSLNAPATAEFLLTHNQVAGRVKVEHLHTGAFSQTAYGDEAARRLAQLRTHYEQATELWRDLPPAHRDAFFQMFTFRVHATYLLSAQFYYADRSLLARRQGKAQAATRYVELSRALKEQLRALIHYYNHGISAGKWAGMCTPEGFPPPTIPRFPDAAPGLVSGPPALGVMGWGASFLSDDAAPLLTPLTLAPGGRTKWLEVFNRGSGELEWELRHPEWLEVSAVSGVVRHEQRIFISAGAQVPEGTARVIEVRSEYGAAEVAVLIAADADGYLVLAGPGGGTEQTELITAPVTVTFHLPTAGAHLLEILRYPSLNSTGQIAVAVQVDGGTPVLVESPTTDEYRGNWSRAVVQNAEPLHLQLDWLEAGEHTIALQEVSPHFAFYQLTLFTAPRQETTLGPPPTSAADVGVGGLEAAALAEGELAGGELAGVKLAGGELDPQWWADQSRDLYGIDPTSLPQPEQIYVRRNFYDTPTTFKRNFVSAAPPQAAPGAIRLAAADTLTDSTVAWRTADLDDPDLRWEPTVSMRKGELALRVASGHLSWRDPRRAPGLHWQIQPAAPGLFRVWALAHFTADHDDAMFLAVDGAVLPPEAQFSGGELFTYGTANAWVWLEVCEVELHRPEHTLSVLARKSGLRVDRLYLTMGPELPH